MEIIRYQLNYTIDQLNNILSKADNMENYDDTELRANLNEIKTELESLEEIITGLSENVKIESDTSSSSILVYDYLPDNNKEIRINTAIEKISFSTLTEQSGEISDDYWVLIIFPKSENVSSLEDLIGNPEIKILSPDIDISSYERIHLLFTYDGDNICCVAAGY